MGSVIANTWLARLVAVGVFALAALGLVTFSIARSSEFVGWAARQRHTDLMTILVRVGADVRARDGGGAAALHWAAAYGDAHAVAVLLEAGADVDARDAWESSPLHWGASAGHPQTLQALLAAGADVAARDRLGRTALHWGTDWGILNSRLSGFQKGLGADTWNATFARCSGDGGRAKATEVLLSAGADVRARDSEGKTPLHTAAQCGNSSVIKVLLAARADIQARDTLARTPLMSAAQMKAFDSSYCPPLLAEAVQALLEAGADVSAVDQQERTALRPAMETRNEKVESLLEAYRQRNAEHSLQLPLTQEELVDCKLLATKAINVFGFSVYGLLNRGDRNLVFSPLSLFIPLAMVREGTGVQTREEMTKALRLKWVETPILSSLARLSRWLHVTIAAEGSELRMANGVWIQSSLGCQLSKEFDRMVQESDGGIVRQIDFRGAPDAAALGINNWIKRITHGRIPDLVPSEALHRDQPLLAITNAIYCKGLWADPFDAAETRVESFTLLDRSHITVPMMHMRACGYRYMEEASFQAIEMPYRGWTVSMIVLLPRQTAGLPELENSVSPERLTSWFDRFAHWPAPVEVYLPRFSVRTNQRLDSTLQSIGIKTAFQPGADFSGMFANGRRDVWISHVDQQAWIEVAEKGTEAAAATSMTFAGCDVKPKPKVFRADHPFMFIIYHKPSGCILFMGRVTDPSKMN